VLLSPSPIANLIVWWILFLKNIYISAPLHPALPALALARRSSSQWRGLEAWGKLGAIIWPGL
jgi:hypothetical protein